MKKLTKKRFDKLITTFEKALKYYPNAHVNMMQGSLNDCGTPMCHAGWFAIGAGKNEGTYYEGADLIAECLGFENYVEIETWARENPKLWGNNHGDCMFCSGRAFGQFNDDVGSLQIVIDHWKGVRDRVLQIPA